MKKLITIIAFALLLAGCGVPITTDAGARSAPAQSHSLDAWDRLPPHVDTSGWTRAQVNDLYAGVKSMCMTAAVVDGWSYSDIEGLVDEYGPEMAAMATVDVLAEQGIVC